MALSCRKRRLVALLSIYLILGRRKRLLEKKKRIWRKPWFSHHDEQGAFNNLLPELEVDDHSYRGFLRMSKQQFDNLVTLVGPVVERQNTHFRSAISPGERLAVTLRFLATGNEVYKLLYFSPLHVNSVVRFY
jgi:hypothetical protein